MINNLIKPHSVLKCYHVDEFNLDYIMSYSASFGDNWKNCRLSAPLEVISACFSKLTLCTHWILGLESIHLDGWLTLYLTGIDDAQVPSERFVKYIQRVFICGENVYRQKCHLIYSEALLGKPSATNERISSYLKISPWKTQGQGHDQSQSIWLHSRLGVQLTRSIYFMAIGLSGAEI